jgi:peptidyl-prolyl cis-trans isomerase A (cyclophilin A)
MLNAHFTTSEGNFTIRLFEQEAPNTVANFTGLAEGTKEWTDPKTGQRVKRPYYDGLIFHRIIADFMIQGGDPLGTGTGGPGYSVVEAPPKNLHYTHGIVAMAKGSTEPSGASGSQFFVVTAPTDTGLRPEYALLGKVTQGLDVVDTIGSADLDPSSTGDGPPASPIVIDSVKIASS